MRLRVEWLTVALDTFADLYVATDPDSRKRMAEGIDALNQR